MYVGYSFSPADSLRCRAIINLSLSAAFYFIGQLFLLLLHKDNEIKMIMEDSDFRRPMETMPPLLFREKKNLQFYIDRGYATKDLFSSLFSFKASKSIGLA